MSTVPSNNRKSVTIAELGCHRSVENITEGLTGLTLVSFFKGFMKKFYPI